jgi:hypothetical protein
MSVNSRPSINVDRNDLSARKDINPVLRVASLGHAMVAFINGEFIGNCNLHILIIIALEHV